MEKKPLTKHREIRGGGIREKICAKLIMGYHRNNKMNELEKFYKKSHIYSQLT
mgnify:CR=1 FL=1|jgi:hypothetical protein